jgi:hypothetical protein
MKRACYALVLASACAPDTQTLGHMVTNHTFGTPRWATSFGGSMASGSGIDSVDDVTIDAHGDVLAIGTFWDQVDFGGAPVPYKPGDLASYITKRSGHDGSELWTVSAGTGASEDIRITSVTTDADRNVFVSGAASGGSPTFLGTTLPIGEDAMFVAKLDPAGHLVWVRELSPETAPHTQQQSLSAGVRIADDGRIYVAASFAGTVTFPNGSFTGGDLDISNAALVAALDPNGQVLWGRAFQGQGRQDAVGLAVMPDGGIAATGFTSTSGSFEGPPMVRPINDAPYTPWTARFDRDGHLMWQRLLGDLPGDGVKLGPIATLPDGTLAVSFAAQMQVHGTPIPGVALLDRETGDTRANTLPPDHVPPGGGWASALAVASDRTLIVGGSTSIGLLDLGNGSITASAYLAAYDPAATPDTLPAQLAICPSLPLECELQRTAVAPTGELVYAATVSGPTDFGNGAHVSTPTGQVALVMLEP